ncbi:hypothetical protein [Micromonospora sp. U21]|uniref:hypothetical protein n=1 Tax=Micromonospora sp. U21 TaxID=2824899 RepID=UPI001B39480E|nr:hypothetical protein [Micromonospora sp. U21]MBQ0905026.1 hypothetical protein [Micromonospora sp. U21]
MTDWYGRRASWWAPLEAAARRRLGPTLSHQHILDPACYTGQCEIVVYRIEALEVIGDPDPVEVTIRFHKLPPYDTYGLSPEDYPRVFAKPGATSKHRMPDGALCMWMPLDPPQRRWTHDKGLLELVELTRRHLFLEDYWRRTGVWLLEDAPHGLPQSEGGGRTWSTPKQRKPAGRPRRRQSSSSL